MRINQGPYVWRLTGSQRQFDTKPPRLCLHLHELDLTMCLSLIDNGGKKRGSGTTRPLPVVSRREPPRTRVAITIPYE